MSENKASIFLSRHAHAHTHTHAHAHTHTHESISTIWLQNHDSVFSLKCVINYTKIFSRGNNVVVQQQHCCLENEIIIFEAGCGSWFLVPGSWFLVPGSWFVSREAWGARRGAWGVRRGA